MCEGEGCMCVSSVSVSNVFNKHFYQITVFTRFAHYTGKPSGSSGCDHTNSLPQMLATCLSILTLAAGPLVLTW